jgi:hypothetical protein
MNKEQEDILNDAYENYVKIVESNKELYLERDGYIRNILTKDDFIKESKYNNEFSEKWGLTIEERGLNPGERQSVLEKKGPVYQGVLRSKAKKYKTSKKIFEVIDQTCDEFNIPTKLIKITYNDKKIEIYE